MIDFTVLLFLTGCLFSHCQSSLVNNSQAQFLDSSSRILNGEFVKEPYSFMVSIQKRLENSSDPFVHLCGGSLLDEHHLLTAGHCFWQEEGEPPLEYQAVIGKLNFTDDQDAILFTRFDAQVHPDFDINSNLPNDVTVIRLPTPVDTELFKPVCLEANSPDVENPDIFLIGFGRYSCAENVLSPRLRIARGRTLNNTDCNDILALSGIDENYVNASQICAKYGDNTSDEPTAQFTNDSGGPLLRNDGTNDIQVGIVSWSIKEVPHCPDLRFPGVYTRVASFLPFIIENVGTKLRLC